MRTCRRCADRATVARHRKKTVDSDDEFDEFKNPLDDTLRAVFWVNRRFWGRKGRLGGGI